MASGDAMSRLPFPTRVLATLGQVCRAVAGCLVVAASLLVFPNAVPWLIAAWLAAFTLLLLFGRRGLVCLGACLVILVAKRPAPAPGLLGLLGVMLVILLLGISQFRGGRLAPPRRWRWLSVLVLWVAWAGMSLDWFAAAHCRHPVALQAGRPVACVGDSMTSQGVFGGYPRDLQSLVSLPVVNLGVGGISTAQALEYLPDIARCRPQAVVIELGGHDFLRGYSRASTKANLKTIIAAARQAGAEPVLMEIPRAFLSDPYWGLEREIAREEDVELIPDTALRVILLRSPLFFPGSWLGEPYLADETGIHPNARGNRVLAESVAKALERMYGPHVRSATR
jgi:lysophospholipase L1-like esterase